MHSSILKKAFSMDEIGFCRSVHEKGRGFMDEIELSGAGAKK